jgi:hypothetical protein
MAFFNIFSTFKLVLIDALVNLEHYMIPCLFKKLTGHNCPGCGFQRSVLLLCQGQVANSIKLYPATLPILFFISFALYHHFYKVKNGVKINWALFIINVIIVLASYIYKMVF